MKKILFYGAGNISQALIMGLLSSGFNKNNIDNFIAGIEQLIIDLNIPRKLKDVGITQKDIQMLADDALKQQRLLINNPREVNLEDVISIYEASY